MSAARDLARGKHRLWTRKNGSRSLNLKNRGPMAASVADLRRNAKESFQPANPLLPRCAGGKAPKGRPTSRYRRRENRSQGTIEQSAASSPPLLPGQNSPAAVALSNSAARPRALPPHLPHFARRPNDGTRRICRIARHVDEGRVSARIVQAARHSGLRFDGRGTFSRETLKFWMSGPGSSSVHARANSRSRHSVSEARPTAQAWRKTSSPSALWGSYFN